MSIVHEVSGTASYQAGSSPVPAVGGRRLPFLDRARIDWTGPASMRAGSPPYGVTHLGHAVTFVWIDALTSTLRFLGVEPEVCRNITDVDDVLDEAARRAGTPYDSFAAVQQYHFEQDMAALCVRAPVHGPHAHRYVQQVIRLAAALLDGGAAYAPEGSVYFRGQDAPGWAGLERAEALRLSAEYGGRPDDPAKEDPLECSVRLMLPAGFRAGAMILAWMSRLAILADCCGKRRRLTAECAHRRAG